MHPIDLYYAEQDNAKARVFLNANASYTQFEAPILKIRRRVVDYFAECERQIIYGNTMSNYYDENKKFVHVCRDETIWCSQKAMAQLSDVGVPAINKHLGNIFAEGELTQEATISILEIVGQKYRIQLPRIPR